MPPLQTASSRQKTITSQPSITSPTSSVVTITWSGHSTSFESLLTQTSSTSSSAPAPPTASSRSDSSTRPRPTTPPTT
ncbi:hypothetical protein ACFX15_037751 [Malus domestica]